MGQKQTTTPDCGGRIQAPCKYGKAAGLASAAEEAEAEAAQHRIGPKATQKKKSLRIKKRTRPSVNYYTKRKRIKSTKPKLSRQKQQKV